LERARPAVAGDLGRVAELVDAMREELIPMRGGELWAAREAPAEPYDETYGHMIDAPDGCLLVGLIDDAIIGFGAAKVETLRTGQQLGIITDLFVEPGARAVGVGEAIAHDLVEFCTSHGCVGVDARALPGHRATKNFFEEHGFTARAIVMHHRLTGDEE
jgi:GNAT superfamily N-acetyltransferase